MVDEDAFTGENMIDGDADNPVVCGGDIGPQGRADILSIVRIARLAVHNPHAAENAGALAVHRLHEVVAPQLQTRILGESLLDLPLLSFPTCRALFIQVDLSFR